MKIKGRKIKPLSLIAGSFFLITCGNWGWQSIESDHQSTLNVFALLIIGESEFMGESFVQVQQTIALQESAYGFAGYDTTWYGPDSAYDYAVDIVNKSAYMVEDATVYITDGRDTVYFFHDEPEYAFEYYGSQTAVYLDTLDRFQPEPNTTYYLNVSTPDGRVVTGSMTTPPTPAIHSPQVPDTVYNKRTFTIPFGLSRVVNHIRGRTFSLAGWSCGSNQEHFLPDGNDTLWTSRVQDCTFSEEEPDSLLIQIQVMDDNYYDYFIKHPDRDEYINIFIGDQGTSGYSRGIEGGFGLFGALAVDEIKRVYVP